MKKIIITLLAAGSILAGCSSSSGQAPTVKDGTKPAAAVTAAGTATQASGTRPAAATAPAQAAPIKPEIGKIMAFEEFELTINSIKKAKGYDSEGILIDYTFKNLSEESVMPFLSSSLRLFQNGVEVEHGFYTSNSDKVSTRLRNATTDIKKGVPISCLTYYETTSDSPLEVRIEPLFSFDSDEVIKFTVDFPKETFSADAMSELAKLSEGEAAIGEDVLPLEMGKALEMPEFDLTVNGIYLAKSYDKKDGVLVEYTIKNKREHSASALFDTTLRLYQNGVDLGRGVYSTQNDELRRAMDGEMKWTLPGATVQCLTFFEANGTKELELNLNAMWGDKDETIRLRTPYPKEKVDAKKLATDLKAERAAYNETVKASLPQTEDRSLLGQVIDFGDAEVTITEVKEVKLREGKTGLIVSFNYKNTAEDENMADVALSIRAYQDGVELSKSYLVSDDRYDDLNSNSMKLVQPDAAVDCAEAFEYDSSSIIVLEVGQTFTLDQDNYKTLVVQP